MITVESSAGSFGLCRKGESISTSGLLSCMPVVIFYKDGDIGLLHYNLDFHDTCIEAIKSVTPKEIDKIVLYTCEERKQIHLVYDEFNNFCLKLKVKNHDINTKSAKSTKNLACLCGNDNYEKFTITNNGEHIAVLSFVDNVAEQSNKKMFSVYEKSRKIGP